MANKKSFIPYKGIVNVNRLNVRSAPTKDNEPLKIIEKNDEVTIYKVKDEWGKISKTENEWVMLKFITKKN